MSAQWLAALSGFAGLCLFPGFAPPFEGEPQIRAAAINLIRSLQPGPGQGDSRFLEADLLKDIGAGKWVELCRELVDKHGRARQARSVKMLEPFVAELTLVFEKDAAIPVLIRVTARPPYRIAGLRVGESRPCRDSWEQLRADLSQLPGKTAGLIKRLDGPSAPPQLALQPHEPLAVASTFKLMLLLALGEAVAGGQAQWSDIIAVQSRWRSLPSGWMQDWPEGSPVTLHTAALLMMGRSDNTAADHLLKSLGRSRLEALQARLGLDAGKRNQPFLTTGEMFRLKLAATASLRDRFVRADAAGRERLLREEVAGLELARVEPLVRPLLIDEVEWHFSAADLARVLDELRQNSQAERLLPLLTLQSPFPVDAGIWSYVGFKGGAECGVFNITLLLQRRQGGWFTLVLTWNNPAADVEPAQLFELLERAVLLLERS